jgi:hypothetical protein
LYRDSATPAASDTLGEIKFNGEDSAGNKQAYGLIHASILSPTSTSEQGQLHFETATAGALTEKMIIGTNNLVINEIGAVFNVRIEGDTDANLFYTDATNSRVGVGTISPAQKLDVVGAIQSSDNIIQGVAGKGFNFTANTPVAGMTSQLLNWYEEGTFTPTIASDSGSVSLSTAVGKYTRIGRQVTINANVTVNVTTAASNVYLASLPFTSASNAAGSVYGYSFNADVGTPMVALDSGQTSATIQYPNGAGSVGTLGPKLQTGTVMYFSLTYFV